MLHLTPDVYTRTSDHFDLILKYAEKIIKDGHAFCDDTPADVVKELREKKEPSPKRDLCRFDLCIAFIFFHSPIIILLHCSAWVFIALEFSV